MKGRNGGFSNTVGFTVDSGSTGLNIVSHPSWALKESLLCLAAAEL